MILDFHDSKYRYKDERKINKYYWYKQYKTNNKKIPSFIETYRRVE